MPKKLWVTVDYYDDLIRAGRHYSQADLDAMMCYAASLGAVRVQWILDTIWTFYDQDNPGGFDLLQEACAAAHRHGMTFAVIFKPFEGVLAGASGILPHGLDLPDDAPVIDSIGGVIHACRPEALRYPDMGLARMADESCDPGGRIMAVRLVKNDAQPVPFGEGDLSLWTSARNGGYQRYTGPVKFETGAAWRMRFPYQDRPYAMVTLSGLQLPDDTRYLMIRREDGGAAFVNAVEHMVELVNEHGETIPCTPALREVDAAGIFEALQRCVDLELTRFARRPEARALLRDREAFIGLCRGMRRFNAGWEDAVWGAGDAIVVARGKARQRIGAMHPVYPEVRAAWLENVRYCIERGVDAVNIRPSSHNQAYEPRYFGFNPPVIDCMDHKGNFAEAYRINGDAYTLFLSEAAEMLHAAGRELGVHVNGLMLHHHDRTPNTSTVPLNFEWQWERWFNGIADYAEYRGAFFFRPENQRHIAERFALAAREAGIPFVYQSLRGAMMHFDGPHHALAHEMDWLRQHPDMGVYNLYEMANFSRLDPQLGFQGSPAMAELVRDHWAVQPD